MSGTMSIWEKEKKTALEMAIMMTEVNGSLDVAEEAAAELARLRAIEKAAEKMALAWIAFCKSEKSAEAWYDMENAIANYRAAKGGA